MDTPAPSLVPKVHPATRPIEPEDPMELSACEVAGDSDLMLRMLVEEYAHLGWGLDALMRLFRDPFYVGPHGLWLQLGESELRRRVENILARVGVLRARTVVADAVELVQISPLRAS
jgi:hypothetical protein